MRWSTTSWTRCSLSLWAWALPLLSWPVSSCPLLSRPGQWSGSRRHSCHPSNFQPRFKRKRLPASSTLLSMFERLHLISVDTDDDQTKNPPFPHLPNCVDRDLQFYTPYTIWFPQLCFGVCKAWLSRHDTMKYRTHAVKEFDMTFYLMCFWIYDIPRLISLWLE